MIKIIKYFVLIILLLIVVLFIVGYFKNKGKSVAGKDIENVAIEIAQDLEKTTNTNNTSYQRYVESSPSASINKDILNIPKDWKTFVNDKYKFSIKYPNGLKISDISRDFSGPVTFEGNESMPLKLSIMAGAEFCGPSMDKNLKEKVLGSNKFTASIDSSYAMYYLKFGNSCYNFDSFYVKSSNTLDVIEKMLSSFKPI